MARRQHIALLRGINVGGKNRLPMRDLVELFEAAGCDDVRTYIQSGNVVFGASAAVAKRTPERITAAIEQRFGYAVPVVLRTEAELRRAIERNPLLEHAEDERHLGVGFLAAKPTAGSLKRLDPDRSPPDTFAVVGREIYLCCPNGVARSKLTNQYFDSRLGTVSTMRNWKTTLKLLEVCSG